LTYGWEPDPATAGRTGEAVFEYADLAGLQTPLETREDGPGSMLGLHLHDEWFHLQRSRGGAVVALWWVTDVEAPERVRQWCATCLN
jgi:hypothetical protein